MITSLSSKSSFTVITVTISAHWDQHLINFLNLRRGLPVVAFPCLFFHFLSDSTCKIDLNSSYLQVHQFYSISIANANARLPDVNFTSQDGPTRSSENRMFHFPILSQILQTFWGWGACICQWRAGPASGGLRACPAGPKFLNYYLYPGLGLSHPAPY